MSDSAVNQAGDIIKRIGKGISNNGIKIAFGKGGINGISIGNFSKMSAACDSFLSPQSGSNQVQKSSTTINSGEGK